MRNKKMMIALVTAALLLMTGFAFADSFTEGEGEFFRSGPRFDGFFGGMGRHHRRNVEREDWSRGQGSFFGGPEHCPFFDEYGEDFDGEEYRQQWLEDRKERIDEAVKAGEISEEEAQGYKEMLEERSLEFEEGETFQRGGGRRRGGGRGHRW